MPSKKVVKPASKSSKPAESKAAPQPKEEAIAEKPQAAKKKEDTFKPTENTKSMTWAQRVNTAKKDISKAKEQGFSINSVLSSRLRAATDGVKSVSASTIAVNRKWYKTPMLALDYAFGKGKGIPAGAVIEFYGPEMGGKTTALLAVAGILQNRYDAMVVIADTEASIDDSTLARAHIKRDPNHLMVLEAPPGKTMTYAFIFMSIARLVRQYATLVDSLPAKERADAPPLVFVWDSIGGTSVFDLDLDDSSGAGADNRIGRAAAEVGKYMPPLKDAIRKYNIVFLVCNQQRAVINMTGRPGYGDTEKPAGGHNWKHEADVRFKITHKNPWGKSFAGGQSKITNNKDDILGNILHFVCQKNKCSAPFRVGAMLNVFDMGVDIVQSNVLHAAFDLADSCVAYAPGKKGAGIFKWRDFEGTLPEIIDMLREDEDLQLQFEEDVRVVQLKSANPVLPPPEDMDYDSMDTDMDPETDETEE